MKLVALLIIDSAGNPEIKGFYDTNEDAREAALPLKGTGARPMIQDVYFDLPESREREAPRKADDYFPCL